MPILASGAAPVADHNPTLVRGRRTDPASALVGIDVYA